jgi:hypothetical protein
LFCLIWTIDLGLRFRHSAIIPTKGASAVCDEAADAVDVAEEALDDILEQYKTSTKCKTLSYWHSAQGQKVCLAIAVRVKDSGQWADFRTSL